MKYWSMLVAGLIVATGNSLATDFACMEGCFRQGYARSHCIAVCDSNPGRGGMLDQPGLPKNPAFDQLQQDAPRQRPLPAVADPRCMKDCQQRGYNYMLCQKQCSYSLPGR